jgi:hypothetical protein
VNAFPDAVSKTLFPFRALVKGSNTKKGPGGRESAGRTEKRIRNGYVPGQKGVLVKVGLSGVRMQ